MRNNINAIGYNWRYCEPFCSWRDDNYIVIDIHNSNFHSGTRKDDSPHYARIHYTQTGDAYILFRRRAWYID